MKPYGERLEKQNSSKILNKHRYEREIRHSKGKNHPKLSTEPDDHQVHPPSRRLDYEKENLMNRVNRIEKNNMESIQQYCSNNGSKIRKTAQE